MKKMIAILTLSAAMLAGIFAQQPSEMKKGFKSGPEFAGGDCPQMGRMNKGMNHKMEKRGCGDDFVGRAFGHKMVEQLDLNNDQLDKIHKLKVKYDRADVDLNADVKKLRIDKREAMKEMKFDDAKKITENISKAALKIKLAKIDEMKEINDVLTKEQKEKLKELHGGAGRMNHKMMKHDK
jgi:Spy/CpxP family protein refolding chaperone